MIDFSDKSIINYILNKNKKYNIFYLLTDIVNFVKLRCF